MGYTASWMLWLGFLVGWPRGCSQQWVGLRISFPAWIRSQISSKGWQVSFFKDWSRQTTHNTPCPDGDISLALLKGKATGWAFCSGAAGLHSFLGHLARFPGPAVRRIALSSRWGYQLAFLPGQRCRTGFSAGQAHLLGPVSGRLHT